MYKESKKKQKKSATGTQNTCTRSKKNDNPKPAGWRCRRFVYGFGFAKGFVRFCKGFALGCKCAGQQALVAGVLPAVFHRRFLDGKRFGCV